MSAIVEIEKLVQTYLDGLHEGSVEKLQSVFHPEAHLYVEENGRLVDEPVPQWLERVRNRMSPAQQKFARRERIISIDFSGPETACVKLDLSIPPRSFTDYLIFLRLNEGWRVVSKVYRFDMHKAD